MRRTQSPSSSSAGGKTSEPKSSSFSSSQSGGDTAATEDAVVVGARSEYGHIKALGAAEREVQNGHDVPAFQFGSPDNHKSSAKAAAHRSSSFRSPAHRTSPATMSGASASSPGSGYSFGSSELGSGAWPKGTEARSRGGRSPGRLSPQRGPAGRGVGEPLRGEHWPTPEWACDPENNMVLETRKDGKMIDMVRVDKKKCYRFGRNTRLGSDICVSPWCDFISFFVVARGPLCAPQPQMKRYRDYAYAIRFNRRLRFYGSFISDQNVILRAHIHTRTHTTITTTKHTHTHACAPPPLSTKLNHLSISRVHAALVHGEKSSVFIVDLGSTNGTFVNERRIESLERVEVGDGAVIHFGGSTRSYTLKVHDGLGGAGQLRSAVGNRPNSPFNRVRKRGRDANSAYESMSPRSRPSTADSEHSLLTPRSAAGSRPSSRLSSRPSSSGSKQSSDFSPSPSPRIYQNSALSPRGRDSGTFDGWRRARK